MFWYILALIIVLGLAFVAFMIAPHEHSDLLGTSSLITFSVIFYWIISTQFGLLNASLISPAIDFPLAVWVYSGWLKQHRTWKLLIIGCLISQLTLHATVIVSWNDGTLTVQGLTNYIWEVNAVFCVILITLGYVGLKVITSHLDDYKKTNNHLLFHGGNR